MRETVIRLLMGAAVTGALCFGAGQALASPSASPGPGGSCGATNTCDYWCVTQMGANYGVCIDGRCMCRTGP